MKEASKISLPLTLTKTPIQLTMLLVIKSMLKSKIHLNNSNNSKIQMFGILPLLYNNPEKLLPNRNGELKRNSICKSLFQTQHLTTAQEWLLMQEEQEDMFKKHKVRETIKETMTNHGRFLKNKRRNQKPSQTLFILTVWDQMQTLFKCQRETFLIRIPKYNLMILLNLKIQRNFYKKLFFFQF